MPTFTDLEKKSHVREHPLFYRREALLQRMRATMAPREAEKVDLNDIFSQKKQIGMHSGDRTLNAYIQESAISAQAMLDTLDFPLPPQLTYNNAKHVKYAHHDDSAVVDAEILFNVRFRTASGAVRQMEIPVHVTSGDVVPPSTAIFEDRMYVLAQSSIDEIIQRNTSYYLEPLRQEFQPPLRDEAIERAVLERNETGWQPREITPDNLSVRTLASREAQASPFEEMIDKYLGAAQEEITDLDQIMPNAYYTVWSQDPDGEWVETFSFGGESIGTHPELERFVTSADYKVVPEGGVPKTGQAVHYEPGDVVQYEDNSGNIREAVVSVAGSTFYGGATGFEGIDTKTRMMVYVTDDQVREVTPGALQTVARTAQEGSSDYEPGDTVKYEDAGGNLREALVSVAGVVAYGGIRGFEGIDSKTRLTVFVSDDQIVDVEHGMDVEFDLTARRKSQAFPTDATQQAFDNIMSNPMSYQRAQELQAESFSVPEFAKMLQAETGFDPTLEGGMVGEEVDWEQVAGMFAESNMGMAAQVTNPAIPSAKAEPPPEGTGINPTDPTMVGVPPEEDTPLAAPGALLSRGEFDDIWQGLTGEGAPAAPEGDPLYQSTGDATMDFYQQLVKQPMVLDGVIAAIQGAEGDAVDAVYQAASPLLTGLGIDGGTIDWFGLTEEIRNYMDTGMGAAAHVKVAEVLAVYMAGAARECDMDGKTAQHGMDVLDKELRPMTRFLPPGYDLVLGDMVEAEEEGLDTFPRSYAHVEKHYILRRFKTCSRDRWYPHLLNDGFVLNQWGPNRGRPGGFKANGTEG